MSVLDSFFKLKRRQDLQSTDSTAIMYLGDESIFAKEINPDASLKGKIVFDVTKATIDDKICSCRYRPEHGARKRADQSALDRYRLRQKRTVAYAAVFLFPAGCLAGFFLWDTV